MSALKFSMKRSGSFRANWIDTHNVCGVNPTTRPVYNYNCELETTDKLDENGFIMDNLLVDKYFQANYASWLPVLPLSCELIAKRAVENLVRMLEDHDQNPIRVAVTVGGSTEAMLTCEWQQETKRKAGKKVTAERSSLGAWK